jgi:hypothetical protein
MVQSRLSAGRRAAILSGMALLTLGVACVVLWKDIAAEFYVFRMEKDPRYFLDAASAPEGSPARVAARRFLAREGSFVRVLEALREGRTDSAPVQGALPAINGDLQEKGEPGDTTVKRE